MGQTSSSTATTEADLGQLHSKLSAHFEIIKSLTIVSHKEVVDCIEELNTVTRSFTDTAGKQLRFIIKKGSDSTVFWKGTIRIRCLKINTRTNKIESFRLLTLRQFVMIYKEIIEQVSTLSSPREDDPNRANSPDSSSRRDELTASTFFLLPDKTEMREEDTENECCVCMDRKACIMLSCCHEFCEICIDSWTKDGQHSNCPLCRTSVSGADDTWVLTDKTDSGDYVSEVRDYFVGIADRASDPQP